MQESKDPNRVFPIYIICDESQSMEGSKIDAFNKALPEMHKAIASNPIVSDILRLGMIAFSDSAEVLLPLSKMTDLVDLPGLVVKAGTNYGNAFTCLKQTIQEDLAALKAQNEVIVNRPIVLFISGSAPTDTEWRTAHAAVADKNWSFSPHIIAIGFGAIQAETIRDIATKVDKSGTYFAYLVDENADLVALLKEILFSLSRAIIGYGGRLEFPDHGSGFIKLNES
jgi:uncharacterized protein YegL